MARVGVRIGLGTINKDHFVCRLGIWAAVCEGGIGDYIPGRVGGRIWENGPGGRDGRIRENIYGCLVMLIGDRGRNACEVFIWNSIPGRAGGGIAENGTGGWEIRSRDWN
jgi:hypothetical protein